MFSKVLIANRGEIAVRIARTLREMGITSVAAFSDADRDAPFVQFADEAYRLGPESPAESYLNVGALLDVAARAGAQAVHPGYGFLAENASFAEAVTQQGLTFIGPSVEAIRVMGDKVTARRAVQALDVPVVPGTSEPVSNVETALEFGRAHGYPIAVKASGGGGGRGIRVVTTPDGMQEALKRAQREAEAYFKNPAVYVERYYHDPRHVEVQVLGDNSGHVIHVGERDCSVQRRHQKLIEEAPSPAVSAALRDRLGELAVRAASSVSYTSAGTVEFLLTREDEVFFLEMNTRIQVEHPVTEAVAGVDLIREMVLVAMGEQLSLDGSIDRPQGHAIEVRINAEDPSADFRPSPELISRYRAPGGPGVRVDSGVEAGYTIPQSYDSMMAKLIAWAPNREQARRRMIRAIDEFVLEGPPTTMPFARAVMQNPIFARGSAGTMFLADNLPELTSAEPSRLSSGSPAQATAVERDRPRVFDVEVNRRVFTVQVAEIKRSAQPSTFSERRAPRREARTQISGGPTLASPMHGTVVSIKKVVGEEVHAGETLFIVEAMKMENEVPAHKSGVLSAVLAEVGSTVETGQDLAQID